MKKIFTLLAAFALSLTAANAQITNDAFIKKDAQSVMNVKRGEQLPASKSSKAKVPQKKIELETGEHLVGFYTSDDLPNYTGGYFGLGCTGQVLMGVVFEDNVLGKCVGGEITKVRFALADNTTDVAGLYIIEASTLYGVELEETVAHVDLSSVSTVAGWNDVTLPSPVTVESGKEYYIAYEYTSTGYNTPIVTDGTLDDVEFPSEMYGMVACGDLEGTGEPVVWGILPSWGNVCIQAVVKGGLFADDDIVLKDLVADKYAKAGGTIDYSYEIKNEGDDQPDSYSLNLCIDSTVVKTVDNPLKKLTNSLQTVYGTLTVPTDLSDGKHTFSVEVAAINGNVPTEDTDDDIVEAALTIYSEQVDRQMNLIEEFTSVQCTFCSLGQAVVEAMLEQHPGKYAPVAIHTSGMGDDPFSMSDVIGDFESYTMSSGASYPSAAFNRYYYNDPEFNPNGLIALPLGYDDADYTAELLDELVSDVYDKIPAFATVDIDTEYDETTRELTIKVSGDGVSGASDFLDGQSLLVYLTEDGIVSTQLVLGDYVDDYVHNHVLRALLPEPESQYLYGDEIESQYLYGDEINWTSDKTYENDYTITLDDGWNADNMHVIAFIGKDPYPDGFPSGALRDYWADFDDGYINNANMAVLGGTSDGIRGIAVSGGNATEVARYTTDGRQVSTPVKGLNIVKMSDGTNRKVLVK
ncbi:MAG: Omp28-related outer membrane protein [Prevotella sp.]|nr:Omp28-related outer membrane protein [Prevotella sp.]